MFFSCFLLGVGVASSSSSSSSDSSRPPTSPTSLVSQDFSSQNHYFYQRMEDLQGLIQRYNDGGQTDPTICALLAIALDELGNPEENQDCAEALEKLRRCPGYTYPSFSEDENVKAQVEAYRSNPSKENSALKQTAPLTYLEIKGTYERTNSQNDQANMTFAEYKELAHKLSQQVQSLIALINSSQKLVG